MKVRTVEYINTKGQLVDYFIDYTQNNKKITAGTILDVSEGRARELMGENPLNIKFAEPVIEDEEIEIIEEQTDLKNLSRQELFEVADNLDIAYAKNISTANLIKKIEEKQNS